MNQTVSMVNIELDGAPKREARFMAPFAMDEVTLRLERGFEQHSEEEKAEDHWAHDQLNC